MAAPAGSGAAKPRDLAGTGAAESHEPPANDAAKPRDLAGTGAAKPREPPGNDAAKPREPAAPPGRRELTKQANRAAILDAARDVFAEHGYDGAAVRHIVARTQLAPGTFYNYFPDKESIFRALVNESIARVRERLREARRTATNLDEFVGGAYHAYFEAMADDPTMFQLMRRNAGTIRAMLDDPVLAAGVDELLEDLEHAIERKELPPLDAKYMARAMAGAGLEIAMEMFERPGPPDVNGASRFATALFMGGIERMGRRAPTTGSVSRPAG